MECNLKIDVRQKQILSQQLIQNMEILQMNSLELAQYIQSLALENPTIELDTLAPEVPISALTEESPNLWQTFSTHQNHKEYRSIFNNNDFPTQWYDSISNEETLENYLSTQLLTKNYSKEDFLRMKYLILLLDSKGYFTEDIVETANLLHITKDHALFLLLEIQKLDPPGIAARSLQECLLLQLYRQKSYSVIEETLIKDYLHEIGKNHIQDIAKKMKLPLNTIIEACTTIKSLNPKPGNLFSNNNSTEHIIPDIIITICNGQLQPTINESLFPKITINEDYRTLLQTDIENSARQYLKDKIAQAKWLQSNIKQRTNTLLQITNIIITAQKDFFLHGISHKKPLRLIDIADELDIHESTVSRAIRGKYFQCSHGTFPLKSLFSTGVAKNNTMTETISSDQIKHWIKEIIDTENKERPLSDQKIADLLSKGNITVSRRAVNKYRTSLGIPDKTNRKEWF